jgi:alkylhydroperoxidase/carboxymuconolactone decarboxylase family protein YurZ
MTTWKSDSVAAALDASANGWVDDIGRFSPSAKNGLDQILQQHFNAGARVGDKLMHLVWAGQDLVVTHLFPVGAQIHIRLALELGATAEEVIEVFQIATTVSDRTFARALPVVAEEAAAAGLELPGTGSDLSDEARELIRRTTEKLGFTPEWLKLAVQLNPEFVESYLAFGHRVNDSSGLDPRSRALIYLGVFSSPALIEEAQVRRYTAQAIAAGASAQDLIDVVSLGTGIGMHSVMTGVPLLVDHAKS